MSFQELTWAELNYLKFMLPKITPLFIQLMSYKEHKFFKQKYVYNTKTQTNWQNLEPFPATMTKTTTTTMTMTTTTTTTLKARRTILALKKECASINENKKRTLLTSTIHFLLLSWKKRRIEGGISIYSSCIWNTHSISSTDILVWRFWKGQIILLLEVCKFDQ